MSCLGGRRGTAEFGESGVGQFEPDQAAFLTERAEVNEVASELVQEGLPIGRRGGRKQRGGIDVEELAAAGDLMLGLAVGQPAEVADADKAGGQDVKEEAAEELDGVQGEYFFHTAVAVVFPGKRDAAVFELEQTVIGDSDAVGVATEIGDDQGGAAEGALGVDDPSLMGEGAQPAAEGMGIGQRSQIGEERELSLLKGLEQGLLEQVAEASAEDFDWKEEMFALFGALASDPAQAVG